MASISYSTGKFIVKRNLRKKQERLVFILLGTWNIFIIITKLFEEAKINNDKATPHEGLPSHSKG